MVKENQIERLTYSGGLLGVLFGSSKGKLQSKVKEMNNAGWNLHMIHQDEVNLESVISDLPKLRCGVTKNKDSANAWEEAIRSFQYYGFRNDSDLLNKSADLASMLKETSKNIKSPPGDSGSEFIPGEFVSGYKKK